MIAKWENLSRDQLSALDKDNTIVLLPMSATAPDGISNKILVAW